MAIIYRIRDNKKHPKPIHASSNKIDRREQRKERVRNRLSLA